MTTYTLSPLESVGASKLGAAIKRQPAPASECEFGLIRSAHDGWCARHALRLAESSQILDRVEVYLAELARFVLPKSNLAKAVTYANNQWEALRRYTEDGRLTIDNNVSERTLRH